MDYSEAIEGLEQRTLANQSISPLLCLPVQLRTIIYRHIFCDPFIEVYWVRKRRGGRYYYCHSDYILALLVSCRQIRSEAYDMYISLATFKLQEVGMRAFLEDYMPDKLALVTSIICQSDQQDIWSDLPAVAGRALVNLRRVHFLMVPWAPVIDREKIRVMIHKVTGGRIRVEEVDITFED